MKKKTSTRNSNSHYPLPFTLYPFLLLLLNGCLDYYTPPSTNVNYGYLVIDGVLNTNGDTIKFSLSHTKTLSSNDSIAPEKNAKVSIEDENGQSWKLASDAKGNYTLAPGQINYLHNLRLHVFDEDGEEYVSPYVTPIVTPPIDSVSWKVSQLNAVDGIEIYANTHDPVNNNKYYLWTYDETWEYSARLPSSLIRQGDSIISRSPDQLLTYCYTTLTSPNVLINSITDLSESIVSEFPLKHIASTDPRLSIRYSMLVHQYVLTKDAYEYWLNIQKNTENLGSVFGSLPVQITGNFTCVTNPSRPVFGFFTATNEQHQRIFITNRQLPGYHMDDPFYDNCDHYTLSVFDALSPSETLLLLYSYETGDVITGYEATTASCADCRLHGGKLAVPPFW